MRASNPLVVSACLLVLCLFVPGCRGPSGADAPPGSPRIAISDGWQAMGTLFEVDLRVEARDAEAARAWLGDLRKRCADFEAVFSRHSAGSELSRLNRDLSDPSHDGIAIGSELAAILRASKRIHSMTAGAFDVTIGPLVEVWAAAARASRLPTETAIRSARERVGSVHLELEESGTLRVQRAGVVLDLDAISKGFVLDRLASDFRRSFPAGAALLSFGQSSVAAIGDPDGHGWRLRLRSRDPVRGFVGTLRLRDAMLSVSSSLGSTSEIEGRLVSHVLDPSTGRPVDGTREAVVIGSSAAIADGLSTALLVRGDEERMWNEMGSEEFDAWVSNDDGTTRASDGFARYAD